jgi:HEAT repeat protein
MTRTLRQLVVLSIVFGTMRGAWALDPDLRRQAKDPDPLVRCGAARTLAREGSADAARVLVELFADRDARVRDAAVLAGESLRGAPAVLALAAGTKSKDELARRNCADALGRTRSAAAFAALTELASDRSPRVRVDALAALSEFEDDEKALQAAQAALVDKDASVRAAAVEAVGRISGASAKDTIARALADPDDGVRCVARAALRLVCPAEASADLGDAASDPSWRVRAQCVDDAAALRTPAAMETLISLVDDRRVRVAAAAHRALGALSGKEIGRDRTIWSAWWTANRSTWTPPKDERDAPDDPMRTVARYHGLDVATEAAAFVADMSGSMREAVGGGESRTRWQVAADELRRTFGALPDAFVANVIFFQVEPRAALPKAQPLTKAVRDKVAGFIEGGSPRESGDLLGALVLALEDDAIDTIFVLSDGDPTAGEIVEKSRIREAIRRRNRVRKCVIDTIAFGARRPSDAAFLAALARDSGGRSR